MKSFVQRQIESLEQARKDYKAARPKLQCLNNDESEIVKLITQRVDSGRTTYGPMDLDKDSRNMPSEALEEILDSLVYIAARLIQLRRASTGKKVRNAQ
jgi:hypothetical protein